MLWCSVRYGAGYHDYVMFGFYDMKGKNRDAYVTSLRNKRLIMMVNDPQTADIFDHKALFAPRFQAYLGRDFRVVGTMSRESFGKFMNGKEEIFAKPDVGESGKGIERLRHANFKDLDEMFRYIKEKQFGVIEEELCQHPQMDRLYPGSVNSLRIVTLLTGSLERWTPNCVFAVVKAGGNFSVP